MQVTNKRPKRPWGRILLLGTFCSSILSHSSVSSVLVSSAMTRATCHPSLVRPKPKQQVRLVRRIRNAKQLLFRFSCLLRYAFIFGTTTNRNNFVFFSLSDHLILLRSSNSHCLCQTTQFIEILYQVLHSCLSFSWNLTVTWSVLNGDLQWNID